MSTLEINLAVEFNLPAGHHWADTVVEVEFHDGDLTQDSDGNDYFRAEAVANVRVIRGVPTSLSDLCLLSSGTESLDKFVASLAANINEEEV